MDYENDIDIPDFTQVNDDRSNLDSTRKTTSVKKVGYLAKEPYLSNFFLGLFFAVVGFFSLISPLTFTIIKLLFIVYISTFLIYALIYSDVKYFKALLFGLAVTVGSSILVLFFAMQMGTR